MSDTYTKYKIASPDEEFDCHNCGAPLFAGDYAFETADQRHVYCCVACGRDDEGRR